MSATTNTVQQLGDNGDYTVIFRTGEESDEDKGDKWVEKGDGTPYGGFTLYSVCFKSSKGI